MAHCHGRRNTWRHNMSLEMVQKSASTERLEHFVGEFRDALCKVALFKLEAPAGTPRITYV